MSAVDDRAESRLQYIVGTPANLWVLVAGCQGRSGQPIERTTQ